MHYLLRKYSCLQVLTIAAKLSLSLQGSWVQLGGLYNISETLMGIVTATYFPIWLNNFFEWCFNFICWW